MRLLNFFSASFPSFLILQGLLVLWNLLRLFYLNWVYVFNQNFSFLINLMIHISSVVKNINLTGVCLEISQVFNVLLFLVINLLLHFKNLFFKYPYLLSFWLRLRSVLSFILIGFSLLASFVPSMVSTLCLIELLHYFTHLTDFSLKSLQLFLISLLFLLLISVKLIHAVV